MRMILLGFCIKTSNLACLVSKVVQIALLSLDGTFLQITH